MPKPWGAASLADPPAETDDFVEARRRWRWLSFALPPDLLLEALGAEFGPPYTVEVLSPTLSAHLQEYGYAETHLHVGAAPQFPHICVSVWDYLGQLDSNERMFESPGAVFDEGRGLAFWLLRAALARYMLAKFLKTRPAPAKFANFLLTEPLPAQLGGQTWLSLFRTCLSELRWGRPASPTVLFAGCRLLYRGFAGVGRVTTRPSDLAGVLARDPVSRLVGYTLNEASSPEILFLRKAFSYLDKAPDDTEFAAFFWQVVRLRCLLYRHVVQRPMTPGLQWFIRCYGRLKPCRFLLDDRLRVHSALTVDALGKGLRSLEVRTSPDLSAHDLHTLFQTFHTAVTDFLRAPGAVPPAARQGFEFGVVLHFIKDRGTVPGAPRAFGDLANADPALPGYGARAVNPTGYRYARFFKDQRVRARALSDALERAPALLFLFRGLDVCTDELGVPNWVFSGLFRVVRRAGRQAAEQLHGKTSKHISPLRVTMHVGEDFVHLLSGLRIVEEAVRYFDLREGDRLGHAVALGIDALEWARRTGRVAMCREDRLLDLLWEWSCGSTFGRQLVRGRQPYLDREIARLSRAIFRVIYSPFQLLELVEQLYNPRDLTNAGFPDGYPDPNQSVPPQYKLLYDYLTYPAVYQRGQTIEWIDVGAEGELLAELQAGVRRAVGGRGITVEVNPSSNLLVGDLSDLTRHPLWRLCPPRPSGEVPPVGICFGSDDPITFATAIREEYQLVSDALMSAGLSEQEARRWTDQVRRNGLEARFTVWQP